MDGVEQTSLNPIFFPEWFLLMRSYVIMMGHFLRWFLCSLFQSFSSGGRLLITMCWGQVLILEYICTDCIPPILLKDLFRGLISMIRIKFWKAIWDLAVSHDTLAVNMRNLLSCFCCIFVILKLLQHHVKYLLAVPPF